MKLTDVAPPFRVDDDALFHRSALQHPLFFVRNARIQGSPPEVSVSLDPTRGDPAYVTGRMSTEVNCGQVRGPVQFTMARSVDPVVSSEHAITRVAVTNRKDAEQKDREMGRKFTIPYGLYRAFGYINAPLAAQTEFDGTDLDLLKRALNEMFETDRSAARGLMRPVKCVAFRHESKLGNARADQLFERVQVNLKDEVRSEGRPPRSRDDYDIVIDSSSLPGGVTVEEWVS